MIPHNPRASEQLSGLHEHTENTDQVTIGEVVDILGSNGFAITIVIMSVMLIVLSILPGLSLILGVPMTLLAAQWVMGRHSMWLPARVRAYSLQTVHVQKALAVSVRWLSLLHPLVHPRGRYLRIAPFKKFALCVMLFLCFFVFLPIPFGNIPPAIAIASIALAEMEDDGWLLAIGTVFGLLVAGGFMAIGFYVLGGVGQAL